MNEMSNSVIMSHSLKILIKLVSRKTSLNFTVMVLRAILVTLNKKYDHLKMITLREDEFIGEAIVECNPKIDTLKTDKIIKSLEAIIRVIWVDLGGKAGLFFAKELQMRIGQEYIQLFADHGIDFEVIQLEMSFLRRREKSKKGGADGKHESVLGYTWDSVSKWKYDEKKKTCELFDKFGNKLDTININQIIEDHVRQLTEPEETVSPDVKSQLNRNDIEILKLLYSEDVDMETVSVKLGIDENQIMSTVQKLLRLDFLHHTSDDEVQLTDTAVDYLLNEEGMTKKA